MVKSGDLLFRDYPRPTVTYDIAVAQLETRPRIGAAPPRSRRRSTTRGIAGRPTDLDRTPDTRATPRWDKPSCGRACVRSVGGPPLSSARLHRVRFADCRQSQPRAADARNSSRPHHKTVAPASVSRTRSMSTSSRTSSLPALSLSLALRANAPTRPSSARGPSQRTGFPLRP